jgi:hypothetical protein
VRRERDGYGRVRFQQSTLFERARFLIGNPPAGVLLADPWHRIPTF